MLVGMVFEVAVDSEKSAEISAAYADRLEVCRDLAAQGLTPPQDLLAAIRRVFSKPIVALVRCSERLDASESEVRLMERQIAACIDAGADEIAAGVLLPDGSVDRPACRRLVAAGRGRPMVFHRAFDFSRDPVEAVKVVSDLGYSRILSAGLPSFRSGDRPLPERLAVLRAMRRAGHVKTVACGGVRAANVREFLGSCDDLHSACTRNGKLSAEELAEIARAVHTHD